MWYKIIIFILGLILGLLCSFHSCGHIDSSNTKIDSLQVKFDSIKVKLQSAYLSLDTLKLNNDSIIKVKEKVITKYVTIRGNVLKTPCDTNTVIKFVNIADSVIHVDSTQINVLNKTVTKQSDIINLQDSMLNLDSTIISSYAVDLKLAHKEIKKQKRLKVVSILGGLVAIIGTVFIVR